MSSVELKREGSIFWILLSREDRLNAMDETLLVGLLEALERAENDKNVHVVAIKGKGRGFSAGGDLKEFYENRSNVRDFIYKLAGLLNRIVLKIRNLSKPVVSVVHGYASGAGFSLALSTDLTVASLSSRFDMGYIRVGLSPDGGGSFFLPRLLGLKRASEIILLGKTLSASEARELGLVNFVFEDEVFDERVKELLEDLSRASKEAVLRSKILINNALFGGISAHLELERLFVSELSQTEEFFKKLEAFLSRKKTR